jgi:hypothetical protein
LRIRLGASKRHGKRCASAQQIATFHPLPPATKYACDDGRRATDGRSSLSTDPMANGFSLNETACRQICAEGRMMRHFRNSLAVTQPISIHHAASFPQHRAIDRTGG